MNAELASIIVALITGISSIITAIIWGYVPRNRKSQIKKLQQELLDVYTDVYNLKIVEERLEEDNNVSKQAAREGLPISPRIEKRRIENRIAQLQSNLY
ncbi:MAG: hypothetical protein IK144_10210 [Bacteroidaceae bacterium]|nr:hypothetical protein [Bacteroidaceae bacterium]